MEKVVSMNIVEFINFLGEKDPRRRVEILGSWIKQSFIEQIEDSLNLALEGVQTEWLFKGLNEENITITAKTVDLFNDTDPEVIITRLEVIGETVADAIEDDDHLNLLIRDALLIDLVKEKTEVKIDFVYKEE